MKKIKLVSLFSGYGGCEFALNKAGIDFEIVGYSEINPHAIKCYEQNHKGKNYGDISKINPNELPDFDLLTGGFPCQDVSLAGKRDLSKGRSILFNEIIRIAEVKKPEYMLLENVKGLLSMQGFWQHVKSELNRIGYQIMYKVLNSKDYGTPQNRERVWIVCSRDGFPMFKNIFPEPEKLTIFLKDILEKDVDKKYYLSKHMVNKLIEKNKVFDMKGNRILSENNEYFSGLTCNINNNDILKVSPCITTELAHSTGKDWDTERFKKVTGEFRRLTPKECFRLMGFFNDEINLDGLSDTQIYRLAGNGWEINVVSKIFKLLYNK